MFNHIRESQEYVKEVLEREQNSLRTNQIFVRNLQEKIRKLNSEIQLIEEQIDETNGTIRRQEHAVANPDDGAKKSLMKDFHRETAEHINNVSIDVNRSAPKKVVRENLKGEAYEVTVRECRNNEAAVEEYIMYLRRGLIVDTSSFTLAETMSEIERFFRSAPNLKRYGETYEIRVNQNSPERYGWR